MKVVKNDLFDYGLEIYQDQDLFKFSLDSILLAEFVEKKNNLKLLVDFCSGNGAVPLILSTRINAKIIGFEIQKNVYSLAYNSVMLNKLDKQIKIINENLSECLEYLLPESVDAVTCNPPYFKVNSGSYLNLEEGKRIARHEITTNLNEIVMSAKYILKNKAPLYIVHRPERLLELINVLNEYKFSIKKIQFIYSSFKKSAIMVLVKATKNGSDGLIVNPPINILDYKSYKGIFE
jgi:tRNA1(Val) A37 N6-methylase TrmN6